MTIQPEEGPGVVKECDVLIVGGGTAGAVAAIQAGRLGARTVLVEAGSQLGGTLSTGGVDFPGLFHAWGRQVIAGIGWELVNATAALNGDRLPDFSVAAGRQHWLHHVRICGALYAALAEEACLAAGVELRYYEHPVQVAAADGGWLVSLSGKGLQTEIRARQIVDCTGNAAVVTLAGLPSLREAVTQPGTLIYRLGGFDTSGIDEQALRSALQAAMDRGELLATDATDGMHGLLRKGCENAMHIPLADSSTSAAHTAANILGRQSFLRMLRFLRSQPGCAGLRVARLQPEAGVRESRRIVGETTVTLADYRSGRRFDDAVAYSFYPIDLHVTDGVSPDPLPDGVVPTIPRGALIPRGSRNLMVAGRCLSSDRLANSALRVQASCMAMGQAAGVTAALAAAANATPSALPLEDIRRVLAQHGAIVPPALAIPAAPDRGAHGNWNGAC